MNAHLLTRDDLAARGEVHLRDGEIICEKRGAEPAALELLYDAGPMGRLMLQTCLLPDAERPYNLAVELARHRIKMFIAKSEEWQMFDLSDEHPAMERWEQARRLFTRALTAEDDAEATRHANESLTLAIDATERLALAHAQILLHRRYGAQAASNSTLGVQVSPGRSSQGLQELISREFDVLVMPLNWRHLEVEEGRYNWDPLDRWLEWAQRTGKPVVAGPLLDFSRAAVPEWMYVWQHDYETTRDLAYDHVERVVQRYRSVVGMWTLASGLNTNENFAFTPDQMIDLVRMTSLIVRQMRRGARTMVELRQPFGEFASTNRDAVAPMLFIDRLMQEGIQLNAVGVQLLFGGEGTGRGTRDLMQISSLLDKFFLLELPVIVSAMGVPSEVPAQPGGGYWHDPWSADRQAKWVAQVFALAMSKPFVESVFWSDLYDHEQAALPGAGLINARGTVKPALARLTAARKRLRKPLGALKLPSRADAAPTP